MNFIKVLDQKADEILEKVGIKDKDLQNCAEIGLVLAGGFIIYKLWRNNNDKTKNN